jgi:hypothetical protein
MLKRLKMMINLNLMLIKFNKLGETNNLTDTKKQSLLQEKLTTLVPIKET